MDEAEARAGSAEWGDPGFISALDLLVESCRESAGLSASGWDVLRRTLLRHLGNRLALARLLGSSPPSAGPAAGSPPASAGPAAGSSPPSAGAPAPGRALVVTGLARTGTTLLHNLLAQDPAWRFLRLWEALRPAAAAGAPPGPDGEVLQADLVRRARDWLAHFEAVVPGFQAIHPAAPDAPEECDALLQNSFASMHFDDMFDARTYSTWLNRAPLRDEYRYYALQLEVLATTDGLPRPWLLKSPGHLGHLDALVEALPGAVVVCCHRDPAEAVASWASLVRAVRSPHTDHLDLAEVGRAALFRAWLATERAASARRRLDPDCILDVSYPQLVNDPLGVLGDVYARLDPGSAGALPPVVLAGARRWLAEHPQHRHGRHVYDLAEFGLRPGEVSERFATYMERFGDLVEARNRPILAQP